VGWDGDAGLPRFEHDAVAFVGLGRRGEASVLAHRPQARAMARLVDAARERILPRRLAGGGLRRHVGGPVDAPALAAPRRLELGLALLAHSGMFPCFLGGLLSRLLFRTSSMAHSRARVSRGSMTSST